MRYLVLVFISLVLISCNKMDSVEAESSLKQECYRWCTVYKNWQNEIESVNDCNLNYSYDWIDINDGYITFTFENEVKKISPIEVFGLNDKGQVVLLEIPNFRVSYEGNQVTLQNGMNAEHFLELGYRFKVLIKVDCPVLEHKVSFF